ARSAAEAANAEGCDQVEGAPSLAPAPAAHVTREDAERFLALSREADFLGPDEEVWAERLGPERDQLAEAVRWFVENGEEEAEALALVGLSRVAFRDGDYGRVRSLAAEARNLTRDLDPAAGTMPLHMLAAGTRLAGDLDEAANLYTESLELNRRLGVSSMVGV